jgi:hypothetical protein
MATIVSSYLMASFPGAAEWERVVPNLIRKAGFATADSPTGHREAGEMR